MTADASSRVDRYIAGELPREEERDLAQTALDDPELFDALMAESAARAAIRLESGGERAASRNVPWLRTPAGALLLAAAAAVLIAIVYPLLKAPAPEVSRPVQTAAVTSTPAVSSVADPAVLTARLEDLAGGSPAAFRSAPAPSRSPGVEGPITSVGDGEADVALGALDGVVQHVELDVYRGSGRAAPVGRLRIETVFRERARGRMIGAVLRAGDVAVIPPTLAVAAARQRIVSLVAGGDAAGARAAAAQALPLLNDPGVHADDSRAVLTLLGALERRSGDADHAVEHLRAAVNLLTRAPMPSARERTETLIEFGVALLGTRQIDEAERALRDARQTATGTEAVPVLNDLGVAAALRGDRAAAADLYKAALRSAETAPAMAAERRAIVKNLADLSPAR